MLEREIKVMSDARPVARSPGTARHRDVKIGVGRIVDQRLPEPMCDVVATQTCE